MFAYLLAIWRCRYFWLSLVRMDLRTRYRRSVLGLLWSLQQPIVMTIILCTVFHQVFEADITHYAPFLLAGLACWNYLSSVTQQGCQCFYAGEAYIRQYPAPLAIYPLRTALGATFHLVVALGVVTIVVWYFNGIENPAALAALIPALLLLFVLGWSLAVLAGGANVMFQDTQHLVEVGFQMLFYVTPILYSAESLHDHNLGWLADCNPLVAVLQLVRDPLVEGTVPPPAAWATAAVLVSAVAAAAIMTLSWLQRRLVFHL